MPFWIVQLVVSIALSVASTIIKQITQQDQKKQIQGVRGSIQTGGDNPLAFIMGFYGTAGQLEYAGTWGNDGDTPNAYFTKVVSVSDLPVRGLAGFFVNGEQVTFGDTPDALMGYPVLEYRVNGKDHLWVKFYDGTQTVADALLLAKFGSDPDRPWASDMIGRGVAYFHATALVNRELFSGLPDYLAEINGIPLTDPRGDGQHENPIVAADNVFRGLYFNGQWVFGPQGIAGNRLPAANWHAQMDKCDVAVALEGGGTEKRFRFGLEVLVDQEPHAVIGELLKACQGRIAEIGGVYKVLVGEPDAAVVAFTDEDVVIAEGQTSDPFPGLESTFNGVTATYPERLEAWENKEAPARYRGDLEALDDNRRLPFSTSYNAVPFPVQVQRLMRAAIEETRRFRRHVRTMPPEWWEYEPLDVAAHTSVREGYENKLFLITAMDDLPNANQVVSVQEIDPADYDWSTDYELPWDVSPLVIARPAPQLMTGWQVLPAVLVDGAGNPRRPSIEVRYDGGLVDVRAVRVQVRVEGATDPFFDGEHPYDPTVADPGVILNGTFLPNEAYEVKGIFVPFSGRPVEWSAWLDVTTPDVKLSALDIFAGAIVADIPQSLIDWKEWASGNAREVIAAIQRGDVLTMEQDLANFTDKKTLSREIISKTAAVEAGFQEAILVATGPGSAIGTKIENLYASLGGSTASVLVRMGVSATQTGYAARYAIQVTVDADSYRNVGFFMDVPEDPLLPARIVLQAQQTVIADNSGNILALFTGDGKLATARIPSLAADIITTGVLTGGTGRTFFNLDTGVLRVSS